MGSKNDFHIDLLLLAPHLVASSTGFHTPVIPGRFQAIHSFVQAILSTRRCTPKSTGKASIDHLSVSPALRSTVRLARRRLLSEKPLYWLSRKKISHNLYASSALRTTIGGTTRFCFSNRLALCRTPNHVQEKESWTGGGGRISIATNQHNPTIYTQNRKLNTVHPPSTSSGVEEGARPLHHRRWRRFLHPWCTQSSSHGLCSSKRSPFLRHASTASAVIRPASDAKRSAPTLSRTAPTKTSGNAPIRTRSLGVDTDTSSSACRLRVKLFGGERM